MKFLIDMPVTPTLGHIFGSPVMMRSTPSISDSLLALLDRVLARASTLDLEHSIIVVDRTRIRRRALPIGE